MHRHCSYILFAVHRTCYPRLQHKMRGDGQTARKHLPERQHRYGQRNGANVRSSRRGYLRSNRRSRNEALWFHSVLSWTGARGTLHSDRSPLFGLEAQGVKFSARFIGLAAEINGMMPSVVTTLVSEGLNRLSKSIRGSKILILGVAYKKNVSDCRESPALDIMRMLTDKGAELSYNDPLVSTL